MNYLQENAQNFNAAVVSTGQPAGNAEAPTTGFAESDFTVSEQSLDLRKIATRMEFSAEELRSRDDFVSFLTTRIVRAVANELENQLVTGNNNGSNSGQLHGLNTYAGSGTALTSGVSGGIGLDAIEDKISSIENVNDQLATGILMERTGITAMRTWHVNTGANADRRYVLGDPTARGPLVLWDVPVVKVPRLTASDVFVLDSMPIVLLRQGRGHHGQVHGQPCVQLHQPMSGRRRRACGRTPLTRASCRPAGRWPIPTSSASPRSRR